MTCIEQEKLNNISKRYDELISLGYEQNKLTKNKLFRSEEKSLLNRLVKYKSNHILFLEDFSMPFDNNLSERDLRHIKTKQKVSGGFRSTDGQKAYLNIQSIFLTCRKRGKNIFNITKALLDNTPVAL